tara:strand:- start:129 stop:386 length:258 start_codon:yes stop_codon:yes gene_type:complete
MKITESEGQYILNNDGQVTVFDSAVLSGCLLILMRKVSIFNLCRPDVDITQDVSVSTLTSKVQEAVLQLKALGIVITDENDKVGV